MSVYLKSGATVVTLPDPLAPYTNKTTQKFNVPQMTDGGTDYVYSKGITKYLYPMKFIITSESTISDLRSFFDTTADGMVNTFDLFDPFATYPTSGGVTVRFNHSSLVIVEHKKQGVYEVALEFKSA